MSTPFERMHPMLHNVFGRTAIALAMAGASSCNDRMNRMPTAPTVTSRPSLTPGAAPGATPLALGETTAQFVTAADPPCGIEVPGAPPEPCRAFAVAVTRRGLLIVRLTSRDPERLTLRVGTQISWGTTFNVSATVESGSTYGIAVGLHSGTGSQSFELTATLEPFQ